MSRRRYMKRHPKVVPIGKTVLLLHFDGNVTDSSENNYSVTNTGLAFTTGKFGQAIKCGTGYLTLPEDIFRDLFVSDFTIDYWCYVNNDIGDMADFVFQSNTWESGYCMLRFEVFNTGVRFLITDSGYPWDINKSYTINLSGWNHIAIVRRSNTLYIYVNGSLIGSCSYSYTSVPTVYTNNWIGSGYNGLIKSKNYIDEFRVSRVARWTTNFTPPTQPYTAD